MSFDPRLTPARPDLAARNLSGQIKADHYVDPVAQIVAVDRTPLREAPSPGASLSSELLYGEAFEVYEIREGWAWGQAPRDGYVGYVAAVALAEPGPAPTHKIIAPRCFVFPGPDMKLPIEGALPMGALVTPGERRGDYIYLTHLGWIYAAALAPLADKAPDFVAVAEQFLATPYLWGGRTPFGCDCSGLVQSALAAAGIPCPRDSDQQDKAFAPAVGERQRGDLVFWPGHVGIMADRDHLLHANAFHMACVREPFDLAVARIAAKGLDVRSVRRV
jgi:cell wall-associated NlpC family hydrolase